MYIYDKWEPQTETLDSLTIYINQPIINWWPFWEKFRMPSGFFSGGLIYIDGM